MAAVAQALVGGGVDAPSPSLASRVYSKNNTSRPAWPQGGRQLVIVASFPSVRFSRTPNFGSVPKLRQKL